MDDEITRLTGCLLESSFWILLSRIGTRRTACTKRCASSCLRTNFTLHLWSEPTLNQLDQLFQTEKPGEDFLRSRIGGDRRQTIAVKEVNDFFFGIVDPTRPARGSVPAQQSRPVSGIITAYRHVQLFGEPVGRHGMLRTDLVMTSTFSRSSTIAL